MNILIETQRFRNCEKFVGPFRSIQAMWDYIHGRIYNPDDVTDYPCFMFKSLNEDTIGP